MRSVEAGGGKIAAGPEHSTGDGPGEKEPFSASPDTKCFRCRLSADFGIITKYGLSQSSC